MITFRRFLENSEYCRGLSLNVDFFWNKDKDIDFLKVIKKDSLLQIIKQSIKHANMNIVDERLTKYGSSDNFGFTYLFVLGQSHLLIHTWPESQLLNLDIFTCGNEGDPNIAFEYLKNTLKPDHIRKNQYERGVRKDIKSVDENPDNFKDIK